MKEKVFEELNKMGYNYLYNEKMGVILKMKVLGLGLKELYQLFDFKPKKSVHFYAKSTFNDFLKKVFDIKDVLSYKDKLENIEKLENTEKLNKKQKELLKLFLLDDQNKNNFKIKGYFTLEDIYFWLINKGDFDEEKAEILLIPKSLIKKETNLIYY